MSEMDAWVFWVILAVVLAAGEVVSLSFFLAPFAIAAIAAALLDAAGVGTVGQFAAFVAGSALLLSIVRPIARRHLNVPPQLRTGTAALVGETAVVLDRISNGEDVGSVRLKGQVWTARTYGDDEGPIEPGQRVHVMEIRGATALVTEI
jgi:membrane protein implicated in regulation of membrane protease activity